MKIWPFLILTFFFPLASKAQIPLFDSEEVITITLSGELNDLLSDREGESAYHPITLTVGDSDTPIELKAKTRGNFRRKKSNCIYPPLFLNFKKRDPATQASVFAGQDKIKLVVPCRSDKYIIREYLTYKIYNSLSPESFNARLVKLVFDFKENKKDTEPLYAFLLEEESAMAERLEMSTMKRNGLKQQMLDREAMQRVSVFEYMIGNTDWSVEYRHNIKLITKSSKSLPTPVPYDFDHSGFVSAPYANPSPALELTSVKQRRYRGYCQSNLEDFNATFDLFRNKQNDIIGLVTNNELLDEKSKNQLLKYVSEFYSIINNKTKVKRAMLYPCDPNGTGNVVIRGLNN